ncbi:MAG: DedA family protein [Gammaproteobacteria bacterium]|nr:DedA family protein [Gammaproteobacteria bacterium]
MSWALFFSALLSATLLPGSSEALLLYRLSVGDNVWPAVLTATAGNVLGSLITYGMGRLGNEALHRKWLRMSPTALARGERWFQRYGRLALLFAWLPIVGDPLCLVAGLSRSSPGWFVTLVTIGKLGRYLLIAWVF